MASESASNAFQSKKVEQLDATIVDTKEATVLRERQLDEMDEEEDQFKEPLIELTPFIHQVGGHSGNFANDSGVQTWEF